MVASGNSAVESIKDCMIGMTATQRAPVSDSGVPGHYNGVDYMKSILSERP